MFEGFVEPPLLASYEYMIGIHWAAQAIVNQFNKSKHGQV